MAAAFILCCIEWLKFGVRLAVAIPQAGGYKVFYRLPLFTLIWLLSGLLNALHWLGFLVDELLFPRYRHIDILKPIFVVGIPRSGTTWLQRVLANDKHLTTLTLTEALLAPSISQRLVVRGLSKLAAPCARALARLPFKPLAKMDAIHEIRFSEPEEDFLLLLPLQACFLGVFLCPNTQHYWSLSRFDTDIPAKKRHIIMHYYRRCLQKHLYVHGKDKQILSKNPSFTPLIGTLNQYFHDACIIACVRAPRETVPSQLSSVMPALSILGQAMNEAAFQQRMLLLLHDYYCYIQAHANKLTIVSMSSLSNDLTNTVRAMYQHFAMIVTPEFAQKIDELDTKGRRYRSTHNYDLTQFGLTEQSIDTQFMDCWPINPSEPTTQDD